MVTEARFLDYYSYPSDNYPQANHFLEHTVRGSVNVSLKIPLSKDTSHPDNYMEVGVERDIGYDFDSVGSFTLKEDWSTYIISHYWFADGRLEYKGETKELNFNLEVDIPVNIPTIDAFGIVFGGKLGIDSADVLFVKFSIVGGDYNTFLKVNFVSGKVRVSLGWSAN